MHRSLTQTGYATAKATLLSMILVCAPQAARALLAGLAMVSSSAVLAQAQAGQDIDSLRKDISYLSNGVCGVTAPTDPAEKKLYDEQTQLLKDKATALIAALDQQKAKITGNDFDSTLSKQRIDDEEASLKKPCPALPDDLQKVVSAAAPAATGSQGAGSSSKAGAEVTPSSSLHFDALTIGTKSDPQTLTVQNQTGQSANLFVWYGTHLPNFRVSENTCNGIAIPDQGKCTFNVTFAPTEATGLSPSDEHLWIVRREDWQDFEKVRAGRGGMLQAEEKLQAAEIALKQASDGVTAVRNKAGNKSKAVADALQQQFCKRVGNLDLETATAACNRWLDLARNASSPSAVQQASDQVKAEKEKLKLAEDAQLNEVLNEDVCAEPPAGLGKDDAAALAQACGGLKTALDEKARIQDEIKSASSGSTEAAVKAAADTLRRKALNIVSLSGQAIHWKYPLMRAVVGLDLSAVSSQTVRQAYFVDFNLLAPFKFPGASANEDALESRWWFWLNPRITSLPKAADSSALSTIDEAGTFFTNFSNQNHTADIAQGFDVNAGVEMALLKPRDGIAWWGEYVNTQARLGISLIAGAGVATPFSTSDADVTSQVNQSICDAFKPKTPAIFQGVPVSDSGGLVCTIPPGATSPQVVAGNPAFDPANPASSKTVNDGFVSFFTPQRSRFFRRYYGGFRLKTYFFSPDVKGDCDPKRKDHCDAPYDIFPGIIDVTAGQDEAVTHGKLQRVLFRVEGVYPLPFVPGFHIFGSIYTSFKGNAPSQPFNTFTVNSPANGAANDANTFRFPLNPLDRDYFRVGVGVDLIQVLKRNKGGQPTTSTSTSSSQTGSNGGATPSQSGSSGSSTTP